MKLEPRLARIVLIAAAAACLLLAWSFIKWNFVNTIAARIEPATPGADRIADFLVEAAPADPQTHLTAALIFQRTLDANDLARSLSEYEAAAAISPFDYQRWLDLGRARSLNGDNDGARIAYVRALELAPNYASVQWAYGNLLIRSGDVSGGFGLIAKAAAANDEYARPAVTTALQIFDGDTAQVRAALGDNDGTNASLAAMLASQKRFDDAYQAWAKIDPGSKIGKYQQIGTRIADQMVIAGNFRSAARITSDLSMNDADKPVVGQVQNGGFEGGVKLRNAGRFEWQIAEGQQPQIGLAEGQAHGGRYSMFVLFNTFASADFRSISQSVAVLPAAHYEMELYYRSDLKTPASLRWEILDAATMQAIASTPGMAAAPDWTPLNVSFTVPAGSDGIIIRLAREGCAGPACQMNGKLSLDDFSLKLL
jgi:tetratricopeptide (TPR) repeat protein